MTVQREKKEENNTQKRDPKVTLSLMYRQTSFVQKRVYKKLQKITCPFPLDFSHT